MTLNKVKEIKVVSTNSIVGSCSHGCILPYSGSDFASNVNHYIKEHGYELIHVGQESTHDDMGNIYHSTVAVLSKS